MKKKKNQQPNKKFVRRNEQIRSPKILLIKDGQNLGQYPTSEALKIARAAGLDLVEVAPQSRPPVCQIMDYGKYLYEQQKKKKTQRNSAQKEKEISFRYVISDHDLETKANQARKFIEKGYRVKLIVKFKAREKAHKDQGFVVIKKCVELLDDIAKLDKPVGMEGANVTCRLEAKVE